MQRILRDWEPPRTSISAFYGVKDCPFKWFYALVILLLLVVHYAPLQLKINALVAAGYLGPPIVSKYANQCLILCDREFNNRAVIAQVRHLRSLGMKMPVFMVHCNGLEDEDKDLMLWNIYIYNLCDANTSPKQQEYIRSGFCRSAAVEKAPILCDVLVIANLDSVFFVNPELIFKHKHMVEYGLFLLHGKIVKPKTLQAEMSKKMITGVFEQLGVQMTSWHEKWLAENSMVWQGVSSRDGDSSFIAIDRTRNVNFMKVLVRMIHVQLDMTGTDREFFWMAGLLSGKKFEINSIAPGSFGGSPTTVCYDIFHRIKIPTKPASVIPFFANLNGLGRKFTAKEFYSHQIVRELKRLSYSSPVMSHARYLTIYGTNAAKVGNVPEDHCFVSEHVRRTESVIVENLKRRMHFILDSFFIVLKQKYI